MDGLVDPRLAALLAGALGEGPEIGAGRVGLVRRLLDHMLWADERVAAALAEDGSGGDGEAPASDAEAPASDGEAPGSDGEARQIYAHILGTEAVWLARVLGREQGPVWPRPDPEGLDALRLEVRTGFVSLVDALTEEELDLPISYRNSAGTAFRSSVEDILLHTFLHGAYHRGQVALLQRRAGSAPAPTDYIALRRGAPAATKD